MSRWLCFRYKFAYQHMRNNEVCKHKDATFKFLVTINEKIADETMIMKAALMSILQVGARIKGDSSAPPTYDFNDLSSNDMMDDIKKLFLTNLPDGKKKVKLWLEKDAIFSLYDDAKDLNS